jgi:polyhydroxybutyrate depolymerase
MKLYSAAAFLLLLVSFATAQTTNLFPDCGGLGPAAVAGAFPFTTGIQNANVPQRCVPDPTDPSKTRCYYVYIPEGLSTTDSVPLVMDIHGAGSCPVFSSAYTGWAQQALANKFVLVYPVGVTDPEISEISCFAIAGGAMVGEKESTGCCCQTDAQGLEFVPPEETMDTEILKSMIDDVVANIGLIASAGVSIDTSRVYATGHSNGCIASMALAAVYSDSIAAVACYGGSLVTEFAANYSATPVFAVHGLLDGELPAAGVAIGNAYFPSTEHIFNYVADKNGCSPDVAWDNTTLGEEGYVQSRTGCANDANVTLVLLITGGHTPYLGFQDVQALNPGAIPTTVDTTSMGWEFISKYSLPVAASDQPVVPATPAPVTPSPEPGITSAPSVSPFPTATDGETNAPVTTAPVAPTSGAANGHSFGFVVLLVLWCTCTSMKVLV